MCRAIRLGMVSCVFAALLAATANAAELTLSGTDELIAPPAANQLDVASMLIAIDNGDTSSGLGITGWKLTLGIQPGAGAAGDLFFESVALPSTDYVMEGNSDPEPPTLGDLSVVAIDVAADPDTPVLVPETGKFILDLTFKAGPNVPSGTFEIVAIPGITNSAWSTLIGPGEFDDVAFANIPFDGMDPVVLGTVTVVPEPASLTLTLGSLAGLVLMRRRRS